MNDWPPFVIETPPEEPPCSTGWENVVFEVEDSLPEPEPGRVIRETR